MQWVISAANALRDQSQTQSDARLVISSRDPPGQRSVYIPPGDTERETYRLATFKDFPADVRINTCLFASSGFYYTGYGDRVKCFSCGQAVENWQAHDDVSSRQYHKEDCAFAIGTDTRNVPIHPHLQGSYFGRNADQASTSRDGSRRIQQATPVNTARDNTATASNLVQNTNALASRSSATFNPPHSSLPPPSVVSSMLAHENLRRSHSSSAHEHHRRSPLSHYQSSRPPDVLSGNDLSSIFPCLYPVNSHLASLDARLQTFADNMPLWSVNNIRATPREIATAGMFYLGERDRVKCFYCNGGLQNWERDDDPWEEHAKWFPMCEFVLRMKGPDYVHQVVSRFPNLRRPTIYNPLDEMNRQSILRPANRPLVSRQPVIIDPRDEIREINRKIDQEMRSSDLVDQARMMGFENDKIRTVLKRQFELHNRGFPDLESLVDSLLSMEETQTSTSDLQQSAPHNDTTATTTNTTLQELRELQMSRICRVCRNNPAEIVLIPCGHLACCLGCGRDINACPVCDTSVRDRIRSYVA